MIKNFMYLSITAFVLFKLFAGTDWHTVEGKVLRTYQGAVAGYAAGEPAQAKPTPAVAAPAAAPVAVPVAAEVAPVAEGPVAGCTENCEGEEPAAVVAEADSPTVLTLPTPEETAPVAVKQTGSGQ